MVSANFLASDFIAKHELPPLLNAAEQEGLKVIWVPVGYCLYEETEIEQYQAVHNPSQPLESLKGQNSIRYSFRFARKSKQHLPLQMTKDGRNLDQICAGTSAHRLENW
jgi:hypothetical protein